MNSGNPFAPPCEPKHQPRMTPVGFEPTPLRTGALSQRLRPLGQTVSVCEAGAELDCTAKSRADSSHFYLYGSMRLCLIALRLYGFMLVCLYICLHAFKSEVHGFGMSKGTWCSGITSASHAEGPGFKSQCVHFFTVSHIPHILIEWAIL